ncbi:MAG TPA: hypothetical protein VKY15_00325 [Acidimicrobiales bacterium]|nr:hypothetical protein [Acidimicrobiales bacterium]
MATLKELGIRIWAWQVTTRWRLSARAVADDRGEGVISAAIAVLIMAFLGVALWLAFKTTLQGATSNIDKQVTNIGR